MVDSTVWMVSTLIVGLTCLLILFWVSSGLLNFASLFEVPQRMQTIRSIRIGFFYIFAYIAVCFALVCGFTAYQLANA